MAINGKAAISIYPNPVKETIYVDLKGIDGDVQVRITDLNVRTVFHTRQNKPIINIDLKSFARGIYLIQVVTGTELISQKN